MNDSSALFLNPARIAQMDGTDLYFMHDQLYAGLGVGAIGTSLFSAGVPTRVGTLGVGFALFSAAGLKRERTLSLSFARSLGAGLQVGVTGKQLYHDYAADSAQIQDPIFRNGASRSAFGLDAGISASFMDALSVGIAVRNLNRPDVGLSTEDRLPMEIQAGAAFLLGRSGFKTTADLSFKDVAAGGFPNKLFPALGLEKGLYGDKVFFRFGVSPAGFSGGTGIRIGGLGFDYALALNRNLPGLGGGSHSLGMRIHFGGAGRQ